MFIVKVIFGRLLAWAWLWFPAVVGGAGGLAAWAGSAPPSAGPTIPPSPGPQPQILLVPASNDRPAAIEVRPVPAARLAAWRRLPPDARQWRDVLTVIVAEPVAAEVPLAGEYVVLPDGIRFEPLFPLTPGRPYRVRVRLSPQQTLEAEVRLPAPPPRPPVRVVAVYPSATVLPENTLRWYVHFSGEMSRGDVYRHCRLLRDDGQEVPHPFLELDEELWSADGRRLTLLFHPGRVKRELLSRQEDGPVLEQGRRYTLVISGQWRDADGRPLASEYRRSFQAGPPDEEPVDPGQWSLVPPRRNSREPLLVRLPKPLDHALLHRMVWVETAAGETVAGEMQVGGGERVLSFVPDRPWTAGPYRLAVDTRLEDCCGNRVHRPFEVDVFGPITREVRPETVHRPFHVR